MTKKKILVLIDWYLPGYRAGGPIRSCSNMITHLSTEFDFFIVTRDTDYEDSIPYPDVNKNEWNLLSDGSRVFYISSDKLSRRTIADIIHEREWDCIYLNGIFSYYFTILPLWIARIQNIRTIVAARGMLAPGALSVKPVKKKIFLFFAKTIGLFDHVIFQATNGEEKQQIKKYFPNAGIAVAPNLPSFEKTRAISQQRKIPGSVKLVSIARIAPEKNLAFALNILLDVKTKVEFDFYGPVYNKNYWRECLQIISSLPANVRARYKGPVPPHEIAELIPQYHFLLMPSCGENFGHVILETMASGRPVIISDLTPWKNLKLKNAGWDLPLDDKQSFKEIIERCGNMDQTEYNSLCKGAFDFALTYLNDEEKLNANRQLFS